MALESLKNPKRGKGAGSERATAKAPAPEPVRSLCGWTSTGLMDPNGDPYSERSQAMRGLVTRRRSNHVRLSPRALVEVIAIREQEQLESMFAPETLEVWLKCDDWNAWELMEWTVGLGQHPGVAALMVIRCGYPNGVWWGGLCVPREWANGWKRKGYAQPPSALLDPALVAKHGPHGTAPELIEAAERFGLDNWPSVASRRAQAANQQLGFDAEGL